MKGLFRTLSILLLICTQIFFFSGIQFKAYASESTSAHKVVKPSEGNFFPVFNAEEESLEEDEDEFFRFDKFIATLEHCYNADIFKNNSGYTNSKNLFLLSTSIYKSNRVFRI